MEETFTPCPETLSLNLELQYSHPTFKSDIENVLVQLEKNDVPAFSKINFLDRPPYPDERILVCLASRVYEETENGAPIVGCDLPEGWVLLTNAYNKRTNNHYFGSVYWNPSWQHIVVSHRGTDITAVGAVYTDIRSVMHNKYSPQVCSAVTFANKIKCLVRELNEKANVFLRVSFTGHSLGGWLAQVSTFSTEYLVLNNDSFFVKDLDSMGVHCHTVVFDSPGCYDFLNKMKSDFDLRYVKQPFSLSKTDLDITSYLSAPNLVNTCRRHIGTIYRIFIDNAPERSAFDVSASYTNGMHSRKSIVQAINKKDFEKKIVFDWPLLEKGITKRILSSFLYFTKFWSGEAGTNEYEHFHSLTSKVRNYDPKPDNEGLYCKSRYQVQNVTNIKVKASLISKREFEFLNLFKNKLAETSRTALREFFAPLACKKTINAIIELFKSVKLVNKEIHCQSTEDINKLITYLSNIDRFFPELREDFQNFKGCVWFGVTELNPDFTNRPNESEKIISALKIGKRVLIHGLGGVGKTEIAIKHAHDFRESNVLWINAETNETIVNSLCRLLEELNVNTKNKDGDVKSKEVMFKEVVEWFRKRRVLFIFDNAENFVPIRALFPPVGGNINVIVTSQNGNLLKDLLDVETIEIKPFHEESAVKLLKSALLLSDCSLDDVLKNLARTLGYLPLALQIAASCLKSMCNAENIKQYNIALNSAEFTEVSLLCNANLSNYDKTMYFTMKSAIDRMKSKENGDLAEEILLIMSYLNSDRINEELFLKMALDKLKTGDINTKTVAAKILVKTATSLLSQCSLISVAADLEDSSRNQLSIHRLVQQVVRLDVNKRSINGANNIELKTLTKALSLVVSMENQNSLEAGPHIASIWSYAKEYDALIDDYIVGHLDHSHAIVKYCSYETIEAIFSKMSPDARKTFINSEQKGCTAMNIAAGYGKADLIGLFAKNGGDVNQTSFFWCLGTPMIAAVLGDHLEAVKSLVEHGARLEDNADLYTSPLIHVAVKSDALDIIQYFESIGVDINTPDPEGELPIVKAAQLKHWDIVKYLIDRGSPVTNSNNRTGVLHYCAMYGNLSLLEELADKGADIHQKDYNGMSPLHYASKYMYYGAKMHWDEDSLIDCVALQLSAHGGEGSRIARWRVPPFSFTQSMSYSEGLVMKNKKQRDKKNEGEQPGTNDNLAVTKFLLDRGADINDGDMEGLALLHFAVMGEDLNAVKFLIGKDANVNVKDKEGVTPCQIAAMRGYLEVVEVLVTAKADINIADKSGKTALHKATEYERFEVIKLLVANNAHLNVEDNYGDTPFCIALKNAADGPNMEIMKFLAENGADIKGPCNNSRPPIHIAARLNDDVAIDFLADRGANLNVMNGDDMTPLHIASGNCNIKAMERLLARGALVNAKGIKQVTPLHEATKHGHVEAMRLLLDKGGDVNARDENGTTPLGVATKNIDFDAIDCLLKRGADINQADDNGLTPVIIASQRYNYKLIKFLYERGARLDVVDKRLLTPLHYVSDYGNLYATNYLTRMRIAVNDTRFDYLANEVDIDKMLLYFAEREAGIIGFDPDDFNCNPNSKCYGDSWTSYFFQKRRAYAGRQREEDRNKYINIAAVKYNWDAMNFIIEKERNSVNAVDKYGLTALHYATNCGNVDTMKILLNNGANVNAEDTKGWTPLLVAAKRNFLGAMELLVKNDANVNAFNIDGIAPIHFAVQHHVVKLLTENGAKVNVENNKGAAPLYMAVKYNNLNIVEHLLVKGAMVNTKDDRGLSPLNMAVENDDLDLAARLVAEGANVNAKDKWDWTPLHLAIKNNSFNAFPLVDFLISKGADVNSKTREGWAPMDLTDNADILTLILNRSGEIKSYQNSLTVIATIGIFLAIGLGVSSPF